MKKLPLFIAIGFLPSLNAMAQIERSDTSESLSGLNGVYIISQIVDEHPENLTSNRIESVASSVLTDAGIPINTSPKKLNGNANLSITVDILKQPQLDAYVFTVEVAVAQDVRLARRKDSKEGMSAETWRRNIQGVTSPDRIDVIELALKQCLKAFVADYHAVNPPPTH